MFKQFLKTFLNLNASSAMSNQNFNSQECEFNSQECELQTTVTKNQQCLGQNQQYFEFPKIGKLTLKISGIPGFGNPDIGIVFTNPVRVRCSTVHYVLLLLNYVHCA